MSNFYNLFNLMILENSQLKVYKNFGPRLWPVCQRHEGRQTGFSGKPQEF